VPIRLLRSLIECETLADDWERILAEQAEGISSLGITSSFEWTKVLWRTRLQGQDQPVLVLEDEGQAVGILPLYLSSQPLHGLRCRVLASISEIYSGRDGFILSDLQDRNLSTILAYLRREVVGWDAFLFTVVEGSPSAMLASKLLGSGEYRCELLGSRSSPYIVLRESWPEFFGQLPKQLRTNLRAAERRLASCGTPCYEEFVDGSGAAVFLQAVLDIERNSWKELEGTSITANPHQRQVYETLAQVAVERGWFSGHLLRLDGEPVAYIYGLLNRGIFYDLKSSFKLKYREFSPGNLLTRLALERLHARRAVFYDFRGECEAYKMRWTQRTYTCLTYAVYNRTVRAQMSWLVGALRRAWRRTAAGSGPAAGA
jgi:CelD/BcsL family acetyltransferase involved in cellulose biosynthesis